MRKNQKKANIGILTLFILGEIITFGFICLLQFVSVKENLVGFIFTLLAMHCGIVCFILSKKIFKTKTKIRVHYYVEYLMLVFYVPFVIIAIFFKQVQIDRTLKLSLILGYTGAAVLASVMNDVFLVKKLFDTTGEFMKKKTLRA